MSIIKTLLVTTLLALPLPAMADEFYDDHELADLMPDFVAAGFTEAKFKFYGDTVDELKVNLICPEYRDRTGRETDCDSTVEVSTAMLTGGNFNDLIVLSHLDGDCGPDGCTAQVWSMMAGTWFKRLQFINSGGVAYKTDPNTGRTLLVAVGTEDLPSKSYLWDGVEFKEHLSAIK